MLKASQITKLICLLALLPPVGNAQQNCKTGSITATTPTSRFTRYSNGTVLDKYTGLMWKICREGQKWNALSHACDFNADIYTWHQALRAVEALNIKGGFANYKDWRVPNIKELRTLIERQCNPPINLQVFPGGSDYTSWTSSPYFFDGQFMWYVSFDNGRNALIDKDSKLSIRLVRDGQ
ncbi:DUF1566 domain-containing protein [Crenothrix polyspora]|uniref:Lcl C-terminal domain-containing protein n=1 Tax=Crenothrix polyspora TaxID=360316 RepID=A0A1R4H9G4_9GAMM|nr:DUF1566 domain-containing protein [Crenothrix polyspora]SJM92904.1 conserved exported hypothetical protein [Crenothrix polyspora]